MDNTELLDDEFTRESYSLEKNAQINTHISEANDSIAPINHARALLPIIGIAGLLQVLIDPQVNTVFILLALLINSPFLIGFYLFDRKPRIILSICIATYILLTLLLFIYSNGLPTYALVFKTIFVLLLFRGKSNLEIIEDHRNAILALGVSSSRIKNWEIRERVHRIKHTVTT